MEKDPYLSVVVVSRNDDHGTNLFKRMQLSLYAMIAMLEKYKIDSELVLIEWVPPKGRPLIKDIFNWPPNRRFCRIRDIPVSGELLAKDSFSDDYAIRDLTPWNVGIRRSRGKLVLSTVLDIMLSEDFFKMVSEKALSPGKMYRIDRCDVNRGILGIAKDLEKQLDYCRLNVIDKHTLNPFKFIFKKGKMPVLHDKTPGDFLLLSNDRWRLLHGFPEGILGGADNLLLYMAYFSGAEQVILKDPVFLYHIDHDSKWKTPVYLSARRILISMHLPYHLVDILSALADIVIPSKTLLDRKKLTLFSSSKIAEMILDMKNGRIPYVYNSEDWGLGKLELPESVF